MSWDRREDRGGGRDDRGEDRGGGRDDRDGGREGGKGSASKPSLFVRNLSLKLKPDDLYDAFTVCQTPLFTAPEDAPCRHDISTLHST